MIQPSKSLLIGALAVVLALALLPAGPLSGGQGPLFNNLLSAVGALTAPAGSGACIASNGNLTQDLGSLFGGVRNISRGDCVSLVNSTRYTDAPDTAVTNSYYVMAIDVAGNSSQPSNIIILEPSTKSGGGGGPKNR